jgi:tryptophanyl-tRNA synthetase
MDRKVAEAEVASLNFSDFKKRLTDVAVTHLSPITAKMRELLADETEIDKVLAKGVVKARSIADKTVGEVKDIVGFLDVSH